MTIEFHCPNCQELLRTTEDKAGRRAKCPDCGTAITVPAAGAAPNADLEVGEDAVVDDGDFGEGQLSSGAPDDTKICPVCGGTIKAAAMRCRHCGEDLAGADRGPGAGPVKIDAGEVISSAWEIYKSQMGVIVGGVIVLMLCTMAMNFVSEIIMGGVTEAAKQDGPLIIVAVAFPMQVVFWAIQVFLDTGKTILLLKVARGEPAEIGDLFRGGQFWMRAMGNTFLFSVMVGFGILACFVPGIILSLMFWPYMYVLVDTDARGIDSLSRAREITTGNWGAAFVLGLAAIGLFFLGVLACFVGLFFTLPLATFLFAVAYCRMTGQPTAQTY